MNDIEKNYIQQELQGSKKLLEKAKLLINKKFGNIYVLGINPKRYNMQYVYDVYCTEHPEIGIYQIPKSSITCKNIKGCRLCGQLAPSKANITHGMSHTHEYYSFNRIIQSITNPNYPHYNRYGGRGLDMDPRYDPKYNNQGKLEAFKNFVSDLELKNLSPIPKGLSIDRIDNNKGYWIDNLKLSTVEEQQQNTRKTVLNPNIVRCIREDWSTGNYTQNELGIKYNCHKQNIYGVVNYKTWKNIV